MQWWLREQSATNFSAGGLFLESWLLVLACEWQLSSLKWQLKPKNWTSLSAKWLLKMSLVIATKVQRCPVRFRLCSESRGRSVYEDKRQILHPLQSLSELFCSWQVSLAEPLTGGKDLDLSHRFIILLLQAIFYEVNYSMCPDLMGNVRYHFRFKFEIKAEPCNNIQRRHEWQHKVDSWHAQNFCARNNLPDVSIISNSCVYQLQLSGPEEL